MYFSDDDSSLYETTYSQDERIEVDLHQEHEEENTRNKLIELNRQAQFENIFEAKTNKIFKLPGLTFLKFTHTKIKFSFQPSKIVTYVNENVIFYCSLKYYTKYKIWNIRRNSFPANFKWRIFAIFYSGDYFAIHDDNVGTAILRIYNHLKFWADKEESFRLEKFQRFCDNDDVFLDSDDEVLFLNEEEKIKLHQERDKILQRMIPPTRPIRKKRRIAR